MHRVQGRRLWNAFWSPDSYGIVILLIVANYALGVSVDGSWSPAVVVFVQMATLTFVLRTARVGQAARLVSLSVAAVAGVVATVQLLLGASDARASAAVPFASIVLYLIALGVIVRSVATRDVIDAKSALGAIAAYLCIGMMFAAAYLTVSIAQGGPFFGAQGDATTSQVLFFSMTTLTTTGYGNLVPAVNPGQSLAVLEMVLGQLFLIAAVGKVISAVPSRRERNTRTPSG
jgi:hypothetical protein